MHRFRKKSDPKRSQTLNSPDFDPFNALPELPPTNDFRTSLILPDLSRRFSLLRSATGDPVPILKTRLANQRARGAPNQISEEEEDMLLETLGRLRLRGTTSPDASQEHVVEGEDEVTDLRKSTGTSAFSVTSSPGRSTKRYSNNLFGSGRLRDYPYLKSVASSKGSINSTRTVSLAPTEASTTDLPTTLLSGSPDGNASSSTQPSPEKPQIHDTPLVPISPYDESTIQALSAVEHRLEKTLGTSGLKRASMALGEAIKEVEDEVEDEILLPRSTPVPRGSLDHPAPEVRNSKASSDSSIYEAGMAISIDKTIHDEFSERRTSPIPTRTVPGYVPGMPRPMTPRDFDFDEQRSHSTTPRAQSPLPDPPVSPTLANISTTKMRRSSLSSTAKPSPITPMAAAPLFLQRSTNGRYTPDDSQQFSGGGDTSDLDNSSSSIITRHRPASPLSSPPFQPKAVPNRPLSRPSTPSNVIWTPNPNSCHGRHTSWTADGGMSASDYHNSSGQSKPGPRPPALPDSPIFDFGQSASFSFASAASPSNSQTDPSKRPHAFLSDINRGSPILASTHTLRSDTPTQNTSQRSPISSTFSNFDLNARNGGSRRSSRQNPPSSPFHISSFSSLNFAPRANSSRSSLDSVGSSFHSWDETDKVFSLFSDSKEQQPAVWHDFDADDKSSSATPGNGSPDEEEWDAEEIIQRYAGLKRVDIAAVQEKLVIAAFAKIANTDPRDRAPSSMRRRRPSTSQSNYARIASPPPQAQPPASPLSYATGDQLSKASALLNAVVDSINDRPTALITNTNIPASSSEENISPNTRRNRDLALVLFGAEDEAKDEPTEDETIRIKPTTDLADSNPPLPTTPVVPVPQITVPIPAPLAEPVSSIPYTSPYLLNRNPSTSRIPQTPQGQAELTREVQQKTEAAMLALNKNPSRTNLGDSLKYTPSIRRRVDPSQISTPKLVSTTTSVEAMPLRSPSVNSNNSTSTSKLGSRFKRLRGSLRAKALGSSGEETVIPEDVKVSPPESQTANYDPENLNPPGGVSSATETGRFKVPVASPPASAGPGLKGFMARFRNKQRMSEMPSGGERSIPRVTSPLPLASPLTPMTPKQVTSPLDRSHTLTPRPTGQPRPMYSRFPPANSPVATVPPPSQAPPPVAAPITVQAEQPEGVQNAAALERLFRAAKDLGLDGNALNDFLARSGSTPSHNLSARRSSTTAPGPPTSWKDSDHLQPVSYVPSNSSQQTATPTNYESLSNEQQPQQSRSNASFEQSPVAPESSMSRKPSVRKPDHLRRPKEGQTENAATTVVRRTLVYANDISSADFAALVQRKNSARRRRGSVTSTSTRSVHDRVPTPPPPKTPAVKRFSADGLPPMPQLPNIRGQPDKVLTVPPPLGGGPIEKSNSMYDSLYDMYAGERIASVVVTDPHAPADQQPNLEPGPALEFITLANGETIWNIVNGLCDADDESIYTGRTSFASEYSTRETTTEGGVKVFMKEHVRSGSKGSLSSFVPKMKPQQQGQRRPETKVFHSSSAQIGQLIESLSQGADSGSFNFLPNLPSRGPGHSASSSLSTNDINWTVEERLERMLGAMNPST